VALPQPDSSGWVERYEQLRANVFAGNAAACSAQVSLRNGMKAWMEMAWNPALEPPTGQTRNTSPLRQSPAWPATPAMALVLAQMILRQPYKEAANHA